MAVARKIRFPHEPRLVSDEARRSNVTLVCDHRVLDGYLGAECLQQLEAVLLGAICDELAALARPRTRARVA